MLYNVHVPTLYWYKKRVPINIINNNNKLPFVVAHSTHVSVVFEHYNDRLYTNIRT